MSRPWQVWLLRTTWSTRAAVVAGSYATLDAAARKMGTLRQTDDEYLAPAGPEGNGSRRYLIRNANTGQIIDPDVGAARLLSEIKSWDVVETSPNGVDHALVRGRCVTCGRGHQDWAPGTVPAPKR